MLRSFLGLIVLSVILISANGAFQLKSADVRASMTEMLGYHVEQHEFSPLLAKRSLKVFIEQFDPDQRYLLESEIQPLLNLTPDQLRTMVVKFSKDDLSQYAALNVVLTRSVVRARQMRGEIERELIASDVSLELAAMEPPTGYAQSEQELRMRMQRMLTFILKREIAQSGSSLKGPELKKRIFELWERRFNRVEAPYLMTDLAGNPLPKAQVEHYLAMHTLKALAKSLDAHTSYYTPEEAFELRATLEKQFDGIGVVLREGVDGIVIADLIKGGPAERSGKIKPGDLLIEVDGTKLEGASYDQVLRLLQGSGKGSVRLGFKESSKTGERLYKVELRREKIVMQEERLQYSFEPCADGIIGKLSLPSFYESGSGSSCEIDMRQALLALKKQGQLKGLVLDMRENSGGFLNQAVKVAGLFISSGVIVISKYAYEEVQYLRDVDGRSYYSGPMVVLTSKGSASAAEIVAQALQDYGTALVMGDKTTYGKGTIQYQTLTDASAKSFFKVTVGRYYTVSGRTTQIDGVQADLVIPTRYALYEIGERYLEYPLKSDRIPSMYTDPLTDIDPSHQSWFQKNYIPNLQKKLSVWTQMVPQLKTNNTYRLEQNPDFTLFMEALKEEKEGRGFTATPQKNFGVDDLQMAQAVLLLKDMMRIQENGVK